jgi:hypothetical protein
MTDDIVTRLRGYGEGVWCICGAPSNYDCSCDPFEIITDKAADEIERLRVEVAYLKTPCPRCDYEDEN